MNALLLLTALTACEDADVRVEEQPTRGLDAAAEGDGQSGDGWGSAHLGDYMGGGDGTPVQVGALVPQHEIGGDGAPTGVDGDAPDQGGDSTGDSPGLFAQLYTAGSFSDTPNGIIFFDDEVGLAGMSGARCLVNPYGDVGDDASEDDGDMIESYAGSALERRADHILVIESPSGIYDSYGVLSDPDVVYFDGLYDARLFDGGVGALHQDEDGCAVTWVDTDDLFGDATRQNLDARWCRVPVGGAAGSPVAIAMDRETGAVLVGSADGAALVTPGGVHAWAGAVHVAAWDTDFDQVYTAGAGEAVLHARSEAGETLWLADLGAPVNAMTPIPGHDALLVHAGYPGQDGRVVLLDGETGHEVTSLEGYYRDVTSISVSPTGHTLGLQTAEGPSYVLRLAINN